MAVVIETGGGGILTEQNGGAGRSAFWRWAVRIGEKHPARGKPVNVRGVNRAGITAQAADPVVHVIHRNEEDIGPGTGCVGLAAKERKERKEDDDRPERVHGWGGLAAVSRKAARKKLTTSTFMAAMAW
jgi:hypothetical protein